MDKTGFEYKVTVIIPVYNAEQYLPACLDSLLAQSIPQEEMEVLMINDGSSDRSLAICERYVNEHRNFKVISQENQGVSAARNNGIRNAKGKYFLYLDSDDALSPETVKNVTDFFEEHYDEVDVVTYPLIYRREDGESTHWRYEYLKDSAIYDLNEYPYISQTTMNICVKNKGKDNIYFDITLKRYEDQIYNLAQTAPLYKIGYCKSAVYFYYQRETGTTRQKSHPYYEGDSIPQIYNRLLSCQQGSQYSQAIILYDLSWRISGDLLYPYHFDEKALAEYKETLSRIIDQIDDTIILNHPYVDIYHRYYLLLLKSEAGLNVLYGENALALCRNGQVLAVADSVTIVITKIALKKEYVEFQGFLKSPFFLFSEKPELYVTITTSQEQHKEVLSLADSMHSYYKSKIKTAQFWRFNFRVSSQENCSITPYILLDGKPVRYKFHFVPEVFFQNTSAQQTVCGQGFICTASKQGFSISRVSQAEQSAKIGKKNHWYWEYNKKFWLVRKLVTLGKYRKGRIWLYCDSAGVGRDNGYYQFVHDVQQMDGITRYYVTHDKEFAKSENFRGISKKQVVLFGSKKHKFLYLWCEKVITAYIEQYNYIPFDWGTYGNYRDMGEPEIIYLQHGVLHAHVPHKYSFDRLGIDKEVVSTYYEIKNLTENYHFQTENLILSGMPRYDFIDAHEGGKKKILLAPSWRQYLISRHNEMWVPEYEKFENSSFFLALQAFLQSEELAELLESYDYTLDLKLHPIFSCYQECFSSSNPRVNLAATNTDISQYSIFISDFSSFTFDFVYQKRAILYFFPDYDMFRAGLVSYRQLDIPLEEGFGSLALTAKEALSELKKILHNGGKPETQYLQRMDNFFLFYDNAQRERIYQALIQEASAKGERPLIEDLLNGGCK